MEEVVSGMKGAQLGLRGHSYVCCTQYTVPSAGGTDSGGSMDYNGAERCQSSSDVTAVMASSTMHSLCDCGDTDVNKVTELQIV